ncbi:MAG TPA: DUF4489 domain-containing protein [Clostridiales bacterium]|nr:DUF4489 domain-containing protein [Clostridiales bacterium]
MDFNKEVFNYYGGSIDPAIAAIISCCVPKHSRPKKIIMECGCSPQDAIFEIDDGKVERNQCFVLDRVLVNTTGLDRAMVKIDFSSIIFFEAEDESGREHEVEVDLLFKLVRSCNGVSECIQTWRYLYELDVENDIDELEVEMSVPFSVSFCDRVCPGCCEYRMIVEGKDFEGEFDALRVTKPVLSALAQGLCDD